jgi:hypothetical protein
MLVPITLAGYYQHRFCDAQHMIAWRWICAGVARRFGGLAASRPKP